MNTKGTKFLAVLAVLAMAFVAVSVITTVDESDALAGPVAVIGDDEYDHLQDAVDAAVSGDTIILMSDTAEDVVVNKNVTIKGIDGDVTITGTIQYPDTGWTADKISIKNLTINATGPILDGLGHAETQQDVGSKDKVIEFEDVKFIETRSGGKQLVVVDRQVGTFIFESCIFNHPEAANASDSALYIYGGEGDTRISEDKKTGGKLVVNNCEFTGFSRTVNTCFIDDLTFTNNTVVSEGTNDKPTIQVAALCHANGGSAPETIVNPNGLTGLKILVENNVLPGAKVTPLLRFHGSAGVENFAVESVKVDGSVLIEANGKVTIPTGKILEANDLTLAEDSSLVNNGTLRAGAATIAAGTYSGTGTVIATTPAAAADFFEAAIAAQVEGTTGTITESNATTKAGIEAALTAANVGAVILTEAFSDSVTVPEGKALIVQDASSFTAATVITAKATGSQVSITSGVAKTFTLDVGLTKNIAVKDFTGTATFSKGSIKIYGIDAFGGTVELNNDDVLKISGEIGDLTVKMAGGQTGKATVLVEAGTELTLAGDLTISGTKIDLKIDGTIDGGANKIVAGGAVSINSGAVVKDTDFSTSAGAITVYSGSDINDGDNAFNYALVTGKDSASGTWTLDGTTLILNGYNGTYNFGAMIINTIEAVGDNIVSYAPTASFGMFAVDTVTADTGSLTVNVDMSGMAQSTIDDGSFVFLGPLEINQVTLAINVSGINGAWTSTWIEEMEIIGISGALDVYNASISMDVYSASKGDKAASVVAITTNDIDFTSSVMTIKSAGIGILDTGAFTLKSATGKITVDAYVAVEVLGDFTVQKTEVEIIGNVLAVEDIKITNESKVSVDGELSFGSDIEDLFTVDKESVFTGKDFDVIGTVINSSSFEVTGDSVIVGAVANKDGTFVNSGNMYVYGTLTNTSGTFTNAGAITVIAKKNAALTAANDGITVADDDATATTKLKVATITISEYEMQKDGSSNVKADVTFLMNTTDDDTYAVADDSGKFTGTLTPSQTADAYTMVLRNGNTQITVSHTSTATTIAVSGSLTVWEILDHTKTKLYDLVANKTDATVTDEIATLPTVTGASMKVNAGTFNNNGTVTVYSGAYAAGTPFIAADATYNGPLAVGSEAMYIKGTMNGDITSAGVVEINGTLAGNLTTTSTVYTAEPATYSVIISGTMKDGNIDTKGGVSVTKTLTGSIVAKKVVSVSGTGKVTGNITTEANVSVSELVGNITVSADVAAGDINVYFQKMTGTITYNSTYKTTEGAVAPAVDETATETMTMDIAAESQGTTVILKAGINKSGATAGSAGYFVLDKDSAAAVLNKAVEIKLTAGIIKVPVTTELKTGYALVIESGTTLEISDKNANLVATGAALKVSDGATKNYEEGTAAPVTYGKVTYIMKYTVADGYTIYSNLAYALENSDEGSTLTVGQSANVETSVEIGTGITVVIPKDVVLTFTGNDVKMKDGAKILLEDNGRVVFEPSTDNTEAIPAPSEYEWYAVSGTIEFDGNVIEFDGVRFNDDNAIIYGVAATESAASKFNLTLRWNEGDIKMAAGNAIGSFILENSERWTSKAEATAVPAVAKTNFAAGFIIASGVNVEATAINDAQKVVEYSDANGTVKKVEALPTKVTVDGTLKLAESTTIKGIYDGSGEVIVSANKAVTVAAWDKYSVAAGKKAAPVVSMKFVDTTDAKNGYVFDLVSPYNDVGTETIILTATASNLMTINGTIGAGAINALTTATLDAFIIVEDTVLTADAVKLINNSSAIGALKTKALDLNSKVLDYDATYAEGDYTVYTYAANIDLSKVTDIVIDGSKMTPAQQADTFDGIMDFSGKDVTITIKDDTTLVLGMPMIIGTPSTTLGAGSSIAGAIKVADGTYLIVYTNVDVSAATITGDDDKAATSSIFDIEGTNYAVVYGDNVPANHLLDDAAAKLVPAIPGYTFTRWEAYDNPGQKVGDVAIGSTNVTATLAAGKVSVTIASVEGVIYYLDGVEYLTTDLATKVKVGSVVTMKISDTSKYQGTPKIDGKTNYVVSGDSDGKTITATGVSPVEPTPEPEPAGMSLTEILLIVLVVLIAIMVVIIALRLNRS